MNSFHKELRINIILPRPGKDGNLFFARAMPSGLDSEGYVGYSSHP